MKVNTIPCQPSPTTTSTTDHDQPDGKHDTRVKLSFKLYHLIILLRKGDILKCLLQDNPKIGNIISAH